METPFWVNLISIGLGIVIFFAMLVYVYKHSDKDI
jgi:hypothetical protein